MYDFDSFIDRRGTSAIKWSPAAIKDICGNENALPFWVADMDIPTSNAIHKAMMDAAAFGVAGYSDHPGQQSNFIGFLERKHGWKVDEKHVVYAQGLLHGLALALKTFTEEGESVLVMYPSYAPFEQMVKINDRKVMEYDLAYSDGVFSFDRERYADLSKDAKLIMLCSPHNPSGMVFTEEELKFILSLAKERGQLVFADEIHADLVHPKKHHTPLGKANESIGARTITFMAPSKTFNIAGEHFAQAIFSDLDMAERYRKEQAKLYVTSPGFFIGEMANAAYSDSDDQNRELCAYLGESADIIRKFLDEKVPELKLVNADASFVAFIDCSKIVERVKKDMERNPEFYDGDHYLMSHFFGHYAGICMNDGSWFGAKYSSFVRFNYGTSREMVMKGLEAIEKAVKTLR